MEQKEKITTCSGEYHVEIKMWHAAIRMDCRERGCCALYRHPIPRDTYSEDVNYINVLECVRNTYMHKIDNTKNATL